MKPTWQEVNGDETLALDWPIDRDSLVFEIGGFNGRWAGQIVEKFDPYIHIFEPQLWAYENLKKKFDGNDKVSIHSWGLWTHSTVLTLWEHDTDGASVMSIGSRKSELCDFTDTVSAFRLAGRNEVDLCLMNIEGAEYVLIPHMIGLGLIKNFRFFWCQFHPRLVELGEEKTKLIYAGMEKTHRVLWDYFPTAVAWERM